MSNQRVPDKATGVRISNGYTEWYKGDAGKGWVLLSSDAPDTDSVDTSLPVVPVDRFQCKEVVSAVSKPSQTQLLKQMYDFHITLLSLSDEEITIFKENNRHLVDKLIEDLREK